MKIDHIYFSDTYEEGEPIPVYFLSLLREGDATLRYVQKEESNEITAKVLFKGGELKYYWWAKLDELHYEQAPYIRSFMMGNATLLLEGTMSTNEMLNCTCNTLKANLLLNEVRVKRLKETFVVVFSRDPLKEFQDLDRSKEKMESLKMDSKISQSFEYSLKGKKDLQLEIPICSSLV